MLRKKRRAFAGRLIKAPERSRRAQRLKYPSVRPHLESQHPQEVQCRVDGWQSLNEKPSDQFIDLAA